MNDNIAVFTVFEQKYVLMHIKDNKAEHLFVYPDLAESSIGSVINCMIENHIENIDASFVKYAQKMTGFVSKKLKCGAILPLQYKKDAYNDKKAVFSDSITIGGEYAVVTNNANFVKASNKIPEDEKPGITERFREISEAYNIGIILRTKVYTDDDGITRAFDEIEKIKEKFIAISKKSAHAPVYSVVYRPLPDHIRDLMYLCDNGIEKIVTDIQEIRDSIESEYDHLSDPVILSDRVSLSFYEDNLINLCNLYAFNAKISEALAHKVYLKSGAYITIDTTEALTAIDVNSGKNDVSHSEREDTFLLVNIEAAKEIARQIRIRNISGMIIVDFIHMQQMSSYATLKEHIVSALEKDRSRCRFIDFTKLQLCEIIRDRSGRSLYEIMRTRS